MMGGMKTKSSLLASVRTLIAAVTVALYPLAGVTGVLTGTIPATASSGVASFADLQISAVGQYYLIATATGLTSATSNSFPVTT